MSETTPSATPADVWVLWRRPRPGQPWQRVATAKTQGEAVSRMAGSGDYVVTRGERHPDDRPGRHRTAP